MPGLFDLTNDRIGPMLLFVSHASDFVTGQILFVDGGLTTCQEWSASEPRR